MSYEGISIRDALAKINQPHGGWFLPQVQRQYVWGMRDESEGYICLLLDSIFRGYPIGGMVLWETRTAVPHREFLTDFVPRKIATEVDAGLWGRDKCLVYDGQQRLQTLYSVLLHTLNGRVLCFDLTFDRKERETDDSGFFFVDKGSETKALAIRMNTLFSLVDDPVEKETMKERYASAATLTTTQKILVKANLDQLWSLFVRGDVNAIAYFKVRSTNDREVNEIFRRLNTGGIALTQIELTLSKIKGKHSDFEEKLYGLSDEIAAISGGIEFSPAELLQFLFLMLFETPRVDADRVTDADLGRFTSELERVTPAVKDFFVGYLWRCFSINERSIVPRWLAVLPIMAYLAEARIRSNVEIKRLSSDGLRLIHQYFVLSQINDWNTQTITSRATKLGRDAAQNDLPFPLDAIRAIAAEKNRLVELRREAFMWQPWFALKVLTPTRSYVFSGAKPQIDHIFPLRLAGMDEQYRTLVDVLWNLQPVSAEINNFKRARHPREFLQSAEGQKFVGDYDYIPRELADTLWDDPAKFVAFRESAMTSALAQKFGLNFEAMPSSLQG